MLGGPDEGLYSDFTITAGGLQFKVHKLLLATRSPVFRAMIDSNTLEGECSCVKIEDYTSEVIKEMLTYIYTGQAPNIKEFAGRGTLINPHTTLVPARVFSFGMWEGTL